MNTSKKILVTAALPYANGPIHIGHLAGCYLPADIYVRYLRLKKADVKFVCGSDEHGMAITMRARKENKAPEEIIQYYHELMGKSLRDFGIDFDIYSRTSNALHHQTASDFFRTLYDAGVFEERKTMQYYDSKAGQFLADRYIQGVCPKCGYKEAYGDQCEQCGSSLSPQDLINPKSVLTGSIPDKKETTNWYFPLQDYQDRLRDYIESKRNVWKPNVLGQCRSWLNEGLQSRAMTRDLNWGVRVPVQNAENKVLYVWFDAPIGYISATRELLPQNWEEYWKNPDTSLVHFIGKDNIVFHCLIFPAMLMAHGNYTLPDVVPSNEFLNLEGKKISTSRNWAVWLHEYMEFFPNKTDELRYVLTSIAPETSDSEFTWRDFQARVNNELVAILGNYINRIITLFHKYYNGVLPEIRYRVLDEEVIKEVDHTYYTFHESIQGFKFRQALHGVMDLARFGNRYLTTKEPWKQIKTNPDQVKTDLYNCSIICAHLGKLLQPFMPEVSEKILNTFGLDPNKSDINQTELNYTGEVTLLKAPLLFSKIEDEAISEQIEKLLKQNRLSTSPEVLPPMPEITFDDFSKLDIRVGVIQDAQRVPKTDKLMQLTVDVGFEIRTIVSGIAHVFKPEDLINKHVPVLVNLQPRKIRGIESKGMVLLSGEKDALQLIESAANAKAGSVIR